MTNAVKTILELGSFEELETSVLSPFSAYVFLGLKTGRPVNSSTTTPSATGNHIDRAVIRGCHSSVVEQMNSALLL